MEDPEWYLDFDFLISKDWQSYFKFNWYDWEIVPYWEFAETEAWEMLTDILNDWDYFSAIQDMILWIDKQWRVLGPVTWNEWTYTDKFMDVVNAFYVNPTQETFDDFTQMFMDYVDVLVDGDSEEYAQWAVLKRDKYTRIEAEDIEIQPDSITDPRGGWFDIEVLFPSFAT